MPLLKNKQINPLVGLLIVLSLIAAVFVINLGHSRNYTDNYAKFMTKQGVEEIANKLRARHIAGQPIGTDLAIADLTGDSEWSLVPGEATYTFEVAGSAPSYEGTVIRGEVTSGRLTVTLTVIDLNTGEWRVDSPPDIRWYEFWR